MDWEAMGRSNQTPRALPYQGTSPLVLMMVIVMLTAMEARMATVMGTVARPVLTEANRDLEQVQKAPKKGSRGVHPRPAQMVSVRYRPGQGLDPYSSGILTDLG